MTDQKKNGKQLCLNICTARSCSDRTSKWPEEKLLRAPLYKPMFGDRRDLDSRGMTLRKTQISNPNAFAKKGAELKCRISSSPPLCWWSVLGDVVLGAVSRAVPAARPAQPPGLVMVLFWNYLGFWLILSPDCNGSCNSQVHIAGDSTGQDSSREAVVPPLCCTQQVPAWPAALKGRYLQASKSPEGIFVPHAPFL